MRHLDRIKKQLVGMQQAPVYKRKRGDPPPPEPTEKTVTLTLGVHTVTVTVPTERRPRKLTSEQKLEISPWHNKLVIRRTASDRTVVRARMRGFYVCAEGIDYTEAGIKVRGSDSWSRLEAFDPEVHSDLKDHPQYQDMLLEYAARKRRTAELLGEC